MDFKKSLGFLNLAKKSFAVISTSLGVLFNNQSKALPQSFDFYEGKNNLNHEKFQKKILKPKLVLKLNSNYLEKPLLVSHRSHSSHSSHSSHRSHSSHYSSGYGSSSDDDGGSGLGIGALLIGGALVYGAHQAGKNKGKKK